MSNAKDRLPKMLSRSRMNNSRSHGPGSSTSVISVSLLNAPNNKTKTKVESQPPNSHSNNSKPRSHLSIDASSQCSVASLSQGQSRMESILTRNIKKQGKMGKKTAKAATWSQHQSESSLNSNGHGLTSSFSVGALSSGTSIRAKLGGGLNRLTRSQHGKGKASTVTMGNSIAHSNSQPPMNGVVASQPQIVRGSPSVTPAMLNLATDLSLSNQKTKHVRKMRNTVDAGFAFSVLSLQDEELISAVCDMLMKAFEPIVKREKAADKALLRESILKFVTRVKTMYKDTNFHNFYHAADVTQLMFTFIYDYFEDRLEACEPFFLLVICLCHDISHPGASTKFLSEHGFLESFGSLEDFHIQETIELIHQEPLFSDEFITMEQREQLISLSKYLIDATDIQKDQLFREEAEKALKCLKPKSKGNAKEENLSRECLAILIKLSDLANVVRNFEDAEEWSAHLGVERVAMETFNYVYKTAGEDFHDIMNSRKKDIKQMGHQLCILQEHVRSRESEEIYRTLAKSTTSFIKAMVMPLVPVLKQISEEAANEYSRRLRANQESWCHQQNMHR